MDGVCLLPYVYIFLFPYEQMTNKFILSQAQIDGNVVKLRFTLTPRQKASSPMKPLPPPPKRDAPQNDKGATAVEKDAQQRPRERKLLKFYSL
jgi:hypothetical protein